MNTNITIPVLRIFDYRKALEFYIEWLGFKIDWEHQYQLSMPRYMQISKSGIILHLSEHYGDGTPGTKVFLWFNNLEEFHKELKPYKYYKPEIKENGFGSFEIMLLDPFSNRLCFNKEKK